MNPRFDLTMLWVVVIISVVVPLKLWVNHQADYENLRAHHDELVAQWLNCAEGWPVMVYINKHDYIDVDCTPIYPEYAKQRKVKR